MKILILARGYPSKAYPMNGIFEMDQAKALADAGHEVAFAAIDIRSLRRKRSWGFETFQKQGVQVYALNLPIGAVPHELRRIFLEKGLEILYERVRKHFGTPDVLHAHFPHIGGAAVALKKKTGTPLVVTEHSSDMMKGVLPKSLLKNAKRAYQGADAVIAVSPVLQNRIQTLFGTEAQYVPNVVDTQNFSYQHGENIHTFTLVSAGNLIVRKRMDLIVEAFHKAFPESDDAKLLLIGEGPERKAIEGRIAEYGLGNRVTLTGRLERREMARFFQKSSAFVLPSQGETFGVVYIEAMASGLPVIATRCGGPEGFVTEANGLLVDVDDAEQLKDAMVRMRDALEDFDRAEIARQTLRLFSPGAVAQALTKIYETLLKE